MGVERRSSLCYVVPGHNLLPSAGPTGNVLSLAEALSVWADVTVAFRRVLESPGVESFDVAEIEPGRAVQGALDDAAVRGIGYVEFADYLRALRRFANGLQRFDFVLEKSWLLTGYVSSIGWRLGRPSIPVVNVVPVLAAADGHPGKLLRNWLGRWLSGRYLRRLPVVVAETSELKATMVQRWRLRPDRIEVIGLGVNRRLFRPLDRAEARQRLDIPGDDRVLLYVGALDRIHDLRPVTDAVLALEHPRWRLHVVGDGDLSGELRRTAGGDDRVTFHGRVPHRDVPLYIAAADLCLAPYDAGVFPHGEVAYATLKVREYLAGGRPVATVPSGPLRKLIRDAETGFLLANDASAWADLLGALSSRERLAEMGRAAAETSLESWEDTAHAFRALCEKVRHRRLP